MNKWPVVEIFGPTIQGEGLDQGKPCYFIRFGGCDYKCDWCDTPHAVRAEEVRKAKRLGVDDIMVCLLDLPSGPYDVILSGGNPCLHDLSSLIVRLHSLSYLPHVETQGTRWQNWLDTAWRVCVSPKPPSSGHLNTLASLHPKIVNRLSFAHSWFLKVVVFDEKDYEYAVEARQYFYHAPMFLSAGNDAGRTVGNPERVDYRIQSEVTYDLLERTRWLTERAMNDTRMHDVRVQSQQHVLLWGNKVGV